MPPRPKTAREAGIMQGFPPPPDKRVTLENWDRPPYNRWSFQHVREILPTVAVARGASVWALPEAARDFDRTSVTHPRNGRRRSVLEALEHTFTDGFIVLHRGHVVYERYFNDMRRDTLHLSQSVAKSVTASVCGVLIHEGRIDRDAPLGALLPELRGSGYADATLRQVMDMRSGVRFGEEYADPGSDVAMIDHACGWKPPREGLPESVLEIPARLPRVREHGGPFEYRSIETDVMAWAMQRATGQRLADCVSERLWAPMGAGHDACYSVDRAGYALADGGFNATLRDYARVGLLYLNGGRGNGRQVLPAEWVRETREDGDAGAFAGPWAEHFPRGAYKNQFWVRDLDRQQIMARGVFGQTIYVDPSKDLVVASLSSWPDFTNPGYVLDELDVIDEIARQLERGTSP